MLKAVNEMRMNFESRSCNESFARSAVAAFALCLNPSISELSDIKTAVSEAVTNCIVHAYKEQLGNIYITAEICDDNILKIKIRDKGCGIDNIAKAMEPLFTTVGGERAGLGFAVMQSFMDSIKVKSSVGKGTTIYLAKKISKRISVNG